MKDLLEVVNKNGNGNGHSPIDVSETGNEGLLIKDALFVRHDGSLVNPHCSI